MIDQLKIGNKSSYDDFGASVKSRNINPPTKKEVKATVPFSNITYDFTQINGETYWNERELEYVFEITADSPEQLEEKKTAFFAWVMNVIGGELHDPFISDYHFDATFSGIDADDSEIEKSTITVTFAAYPYMIANAATVYDFAVSSAENTGVVVNDSAHPVTPTFVCDVPFSITLNGDVYSVPSGEITDDAVKLAVGNNSVSVISTSGSGKLSIKFRKEVF